MPTEDRPDWIQQNRWDLGRRIRDLRHARRLTQEQLAERAGVDSKTISRAENGVYAVTIDLMARIARALDAPMWRLFRDE